MHSKLPSQIKILLWCICSITVIAFAGATYWMALRANAQAEDDKRNVAKSLMQAVTSQLEVSVIDYAWWEDAFDALNQGNGTWIYDNVGTGATQGNTFDVLSIIESGDVINYGWITDQDPAPDPSVVPVDVMRAMRDLLQDVPADDVQAKSGFVLLDGQIAVLSAARVSPYEFDDFVTSDAAVLVGGLWLMTDLMQAKGQQVLLDGVAVGTGAPAEGQNQYIEINDIFGTAIGHMTWTVPSPGSALMMRMIPVIILLGGLISASSIFVGRRVTAQARLLEEERHNAVDAARTDSLTHLANRSGFNELIGKRDLLEAFTQSRLALIYLDINKFKDLNDIAGHEGGDEALRAVARRLSDAARHDDFIARIGGDEFVVILEGNEPVQAARALLRRFDQAMLEPIASNGKYHHISVACGVAFSGDAKGVNDMMMKADAAMYVAKENNDGRAVEYGEDLFALLEKERRIEARLRRAIEDARPDNGCFDVLYQPIIANGSPHITMAEALLRWTDEELGSVPPDTFIPIAESRNLVPKIGLIVLAQVLADMARAPDLAVAINVSPVQLRNADFPQQVASLTRDAGISPGRITLEITEGSLIKSPELVRDRINALRKYGFKVALDDFGTGFASISYLRQFKFDRLKIDKSFVLPLGQNDEANVLFQALVKLSQAFKLEVVAEGIETINQSRLVKLAGCNLEQGFHHDKPLPFEAILNKLHQQSSANAG